MCTILPLSSFLYKTTSFRNSPGTNSPENKQKYLQPLCATTPPLSLTVSPCCPYRTSLITRQQHRLYISTNLHIIIFTEHSVLVINYISRIIISSSCTLILSNIILLSNKKDLCFATLVSIISLGIVDRISRMVESYQIGLLISWQV